MDGPSSARVVRDVGLLYVDPAFPGMTTIPTTLNPYGNSWLACQTKATVAASLNLAIVLAGRQGCTSSVSDTATLLRLALPMVCVPGFDAVLSPTSQALQLELFPSVHVFGMGPHASRRKHAYTTEVPVRLRSLPTPLRNTVSSTEST